MANLISRRIANLDCHVVTADAAPELIAIFCHGFGAPGDDLVPVAAQLLGAFPTILDRVQIVFPCAPLSLNDQGVPNGRAWWPLNFERLARLSEQSHQDELHQHFPEGMLQARQMLVELVQALQRETRLPMNRVVLGGFSQGAMLTTDVALHCESPPAALVIWSGTLLNAEEWKARATTLRGVPILQSHGQQDPILPIDSAVTLNQLFTDAGAEIRFLPFRGGHTIPPELLHSTGSLIEQLLDTQ